MAIDFDEYWRGVRDEWRAAREQGGGGDWELLPRGETAGAHGRAWRVDWLRFSSASDAVIYGWLARPADHPATGAALLWLPGYSYGTPPPDATDLVPGAATLCINVHGNLPDAPYLNPAGKSDYITQGLRDPDASIYRRIALHCLHAMSVLGEQEGVDPERTVVGGMSQGGALALITAAHHPAPRLCFADMPFLCSVRLGLAVSHSPAYKAVLAAARAQAEADADPASGEALIETLELFDPLRHAPRVRVPTALTAGGRDPASRASTIAPVYHALASGIKQFRLFPDAGHVYLPEMVEGYGDWMRRLL